MNYLKQVSFNDLKVGDRLVQIIPAYYDIFGKHHSTSYFTYKIDGVSENKDIYSLGYLVVLTQKKLGYRFEYIYDDDRYLDTRPRYMRLLSIY